jgi:hypothetical protein
MISRFKIMVCLLIGLVVVGSAPRAFGDSGSVLYTFGSALFTNESKYTLYYSIPPVIQTGVKTNFTFYIYLTELSGWKIDSEMQILTLIVNTPTATVMKQEVNNTGFLYQGGRWGPFNMTVNLNSSQVGISPGGTTNATVYANLVVYERYDDPKFPVLADDGATLKLSDTQFVATPAGGGLTGNRVMVSFLVGAAVVVALTGVALATRKRDRPPLRSGEPDTG